MSVIPPPFSLSLSLALSLSLSLSQQTNDEGHNEKADKDSGKERDRSKTFSSPKDRTSSSPITRGAHSPTLAELNSSHGPSQKRLALSPPFSDHLPVTTSILHSHLTSAVSDSFTTNHAAPRVAFADKEGFEDLSASFKSLYKSIFGHSVSAGGGGGGGEFVPPPPPSSHGLTSRELGSSLPLGASASLFLSSGSGTPQFVSLMDNFRDIAESNSWDKLDPSQIQCLMDSFKEGEHHKYGLDADTYADLHASFNKFVTQLNSKILPDGSNSGLRLNEYDDQHHLHRAGGGGGGIISHASMINHGGMPPPHHHPHQHHHPHHHHRSGRGSAAATAYGHPQTHAQIDSMLNLHQSSPPPPSNYHSINRTPSPHLAGMPVGASNSHAGVVGSPYAGFMSPPGHNPPLGSLVGPTDSPGVPIQSAATDLFDEEDDFDWSKLM